MTGLWNPLLPLVLLVGAWGVWRLLRWAASGGRFPLRDRRGTASGFTNAALAIDALYRPSARHVIEWRQEQEDQRDDEGGGDPPSPGDGCEAALQEEPAGGKRIAPTGTVADALRATGSEV